MPLFVHQGYEAGTRYIESLNTADVISLGSSEHRRKEFPDIDNRTPDFVKGFNAAIDDYLQDHAVNWQWIFSQVKNAT